MIARTIGEHDAGCVKLFSSPALVYLGIMVMRVIYRCERLKLTEWYFSKLWQTHLGEKGGRGALFSTKVSPRT